jgi:hypothetical protein
MWPHRTPVASRHASVWLPRARAGVGLERRRAALVPSDGENTAVDLARMAWLATVLTCLLAALILLLQGYYGYCAVTAAVAGSAAINLT